ncbi:MAG: hypothetical protein JSR89_18025 [Proteobacteria bacterium]|nr:hypothetical protein [Pseudomonadota bacterium]
MGMRASLLSVAMLCALMADTEVGNAQHPTARPSVETSTQAPHSNPSAHGDLTRPSDIERVPLRIEITPAPKTQTELDDERRDHDEKSALDRKLVDLTAQLATYTDDLFRATAILAVATVLLTAATAGLLYFARRQASDMKESIRIARQSADTATVAANAGREQALVSRTSMVAGDRAYVHYAGCRWISHTLSGTGEVFWRIHPRWINSGNTPTRGLRVYAHYELRDSPLPADYSFTRDAEVELQLATIPPKGVIESGPRDFLGTDLVAVQNGTKFLYVWGVAEYRTVFGDPCVTRFCVQALNLTGNPLQVWNPEQPFDIAFAHVERNNCSDEDCERPER